MDGRKSQIGFVAQTTGAEALISEDFAFKSFEPNTLQLDRDTGGGQVQWMEDLTNRVPQKKITKFAIPNLRSGRPNLIN
jgi:hypothetical protein